MKTFGLAKYTKSILAHPYIGSHSWGEVNPLEIHLKMRQTWCKCPPHHNPDLYLALLTVVQSPSLQMVILNSILWLVHTHNKTDHLNLGPVNFCHCKKNFFDSQFEAAPTFALDRLCFWMHHGETVNNGNICHQLFGLPM